jgi:hypothetical protein
VIFHKGCTKSIGNVYRFRSTLDKGYMSQYTLRQLILMYSVMKIVAPHDVENMDEDFLAGFGWLLLLLRGAIF